jgi:hypothetical protein
MGGKVKVKLSLGLTKYHSKKSYPVLNYAPSHEDVREGGGIAPRIFNLGNRWECSASRPGHLPPGK